RSPPGTASSYSQLAQQWVCAELVRRVDGRPFPAYLREEITGPLVLQRRFTARDAHGASAPCDSAERSSCVAADVRARRSRSPVSNPPGAEPPPGVVGSRGRLR